MLNPYTPEFANISFEEGIGWVWSAGNLYHDYRLNYFYHNHIPEQYTDPIVKYGKPFLQAWFQYYLEY
ncbi:MAG: hypothetical protein CVU00_11385 [Bacteroidetes bacterium HGW-Bacteroidetes-17]|nr:MAG: hypothetical protein CVU00_11385 [Bacteroidetes bacterium HGW-Bacteroidetes-17]